MNAICADAIVARQPEEVFAWLSDLHNHWRLEDRFIEVAGIEPEGGRVRMRGPLGLSREARTRVIEAQPHTTLRGIAEVGRRTRGAVRWDIEPHPEGSRVTFSAVVERASLADRVLLALGGRRWLAGLFHNAVLRLGAEMDRDYHLRHEDRGPRSAGELSRARGHAAEAGRGSARGPEA
jgi:hypothetical protein